MATPTREAAGTITGDDTHGDVTLVEHYWHRVPRPIRYTLESVGFRVAVVLALAWLTTQLLDVIGVVAQLQGLMAARGASTILIDLGVTELTLDAESAVFYLALTIVAAATFSPWRPATLLFALATMLMFATGFRYTRIERNFFAQMAPFLEGLALEEVEPPFMAKVVGMAVFLVITVFTMIESGRAVRRAYEEKGVPKMVRRHLAMVQIGAVGILAAGSAVLALVLVKFTDLTRRPLEGLVEVMPRVNPVVTLLLMGVSLAVIILLLAWKPEPAARPKGVKDTLLQSLRRQKVEAEEVDADDAPGANGVHGANGKDAAS